MGKFHDEGTLDKVYDALDAAGLSEQEATGAVNEMLKVGILFRERDTPAYQGEPLFAYGELVNNANV